MKIVTILGARPQFIKAASVSREFKKHESIQEIIIHTGQHHDENMSEVFFHEMKIPKPAYNLNVNGLSQCAMTAQIIEKIEPMLSDISPDFVLVYGDTNSTLAGALTARKLNIPLAHVEGGLRNFDLSIPEDVNRILTDRLSDIIFYSTEVAIKNLKNEGYENFPVKLIETGDLMADAVKYYLELSYDNSHIISNLELESVNFILATVHRQSNINLKNMREIVSAFNSISNEIIIIFPMHPNTRKFISIYKIHFNENVKIIDPVGYFDMLQLLKFSSYVITDSGGVQREAYLMKKKSLQLMEYTPWEELIDNGFSITTEIIKKEIVDNFKIMKKKRPDFSINLYGNGDASSQIVKQFIK
jgi:UDP-GlcNAc3NAcA epimerase